MPRDPDEARVDGAVLLDQTEEFLGRFVAYPSGAARVAHVLWVAHTHRMTVWESTPRIAFLSPEPNSGKTRALEATELLVPRPVHAVNTTPAYLFRKVADEAGLPTILYDEIDTVFGPRAKENEDIRGLLNAGHRKGAVAGRCVVRGTVVSVEELPAYCAVALAGLDDLPDTLMSRSVVVRMRRRSPDETVEPFRHRLHAAEGWAIRDALARWARSIPEGVWPDMPDGIADRSADVWEPLLMAADHAGGDWPERARTSALALLADTGSAAPSMGVRLLEDLRTVFDASGEEHVSTEAIVAALVAMDEAPWADIRGKALDARSLARRLSRYQVASKTVRIGDKTPKGYDRSDLADVWARYLPNVADVAFGGPAGPEQGTKSVAVSEDRDLHSSKCKSAGQETVVDSVQLHHPTPRTSATSATPQHGDTGSATSATPLDRDGCPITDDLFLGEEL